MLVGVRRAAAFLTWFGLGLVGVVALDGTAAASTGMAPEIVKMAQCPPGYSLNPQDTQQCTPGNSNTDPSGAIPPGSITGNPPSGESRDPNNQPSGPSQSSSEAAVPALRHDWSSASTSFAVAGDVEADFSLR